jgi:hypothetical protein
MGMICSLHAVSQMFKMFKIPLSVLINYRAVILRLYKVKIKNWTLENTPIIPLINNLF